MNAKLSFTTIFLFLTFCAFAQFTITGDFTDVISFESGVPTEWTTSTGSSLSQFNNRYKHGSSSLRWDWTNSATKLTVTDADLLANGNNSNAGIKFWIYSESDIQDSIEFRFYDASDVLLCSFYYRINFDGWRTQWIRYQHELGKNSTDVIAYMEIHAPTNTTTGSLWFDLIEYPTYVEWDRGGSRQFDYPIEDNPNEAPGRWLRCRTNELRYATPKIATQPVSITASMTNDINTIEQRMEEYLLGTGDYDTSSYFNTLSTNLQSDLTNVNTTFAGLNIVDNSGVLSGVPLFGLMSRSSNKFGPNVESVVELALHLALDFRINGTAQSKTNFIQLCDYIHDQGWAAGSTLGSSYFIENNTQDFAKACFLMRDELDAETWTGSKTKLDRTIELIFWYSDIWSLFTDVNDPIDVTSDDIMRSHPQTFWAIMMMDDNDVNKYWYLDQFVQRHEQVLLVPNNYFEVANSQIIQPDFTGYHHSGIAANTYFQTGIFRSVRQAVWLDGTQYEYNSTVKSTFKSAVLAMRFISQQYDFPKGISMRWSGLRSGAETLPKLVAFAAFAVGGNATPDAELSAAFLRLWQPNHGQIRWINWYLGDMEIALKLAATTNETAETLSGLQIHPFAGLASWRNDDWLVSVKGYSNYVWHSENCCSRNLHGGFDSHGQLNILVESSTTSSQEASGLLYEDGYLWNYVPGATTADISTSDLSAFANWSTQTSTFTGGIVQNDTTGLWAMELIDNTLISGFNFKKSVFFFDENHIIALGSGITNTSSSNTLTTLFQSKIDDNSPTNNPITLNGSSVATFPYLNNSLTGTNTLKDGYGNGFYIPNAEDIVIERDAQTSVELHNTTATNGNWAKAYFSHGISPTNQDYEYAILVQTSDVALANFAANVPYQVLQKDNDAHIVEYGNQTGYAIFGTNANLAEATGKIKTSQLPLILMVEEVDATHLKISVRNPDLLSTGTSTFEIRGEWTVTNNVSALVATTLNSGNTILELSFDDGQNYELELTENSVLPIELLAFTAIPIDNKKVQLTWTTITETNNNFFEIERSKDDKTWEQIEQIEGQGTTTETTSYKTFDNQPYIGRSYYRIKQTDFDNQFSYSNIQTVEIQNTTNIQIFPNPTNSELTIITNNITLENIQIFNSLGQIQTVDIQQNGTEWTLDLSRLVSGVYFLNIGKEVYSVVKE